jgi:hypothetical protein
MDYRQFELANAQCKPKHFGPPTALQRRLAYHAAHRFPISQSRPGVFGWLVTCLRACVKR